MLGNGGKGLTGTTSMASCVPWQVQGIIVIYVSFAMSDGGLKASTSDRQPDAFRCEGWVLPPYSTAPVQSDEFVTLMGQQSKGLSNFYPNVIASCGHLLKESRLREIALMGSEDKGCGLFFA